MTRDQTIDMLKQAKAKLEAVFTDTVPCPECGGHPHIDAFHAGQLVAALHVVDALIEDIEEDLGEATDEKERPN